MSNNDTLDSYNESDDNDRLPEPPRVVKKRPVLHPHGRGKVGNVCWCHARECNVYVSPRTKEDHLVRKYHGYAISERLFGRLQVQDVERVYITERETLTVYEFELAQFTDPDAIRLEWDEDDPQRCVPTRKNKYRWEGHAKRLFGRVA